MRAHEKGIYHGPGLFQYSCSRNVYISVLFNLLLLLDSRIKKPEQRG